MPSYADERRVVTALFADLVGSTALTERIDPEDARLVLGEAIAHIIAVVERYGGHVKDIAGDGVLAFFGAPVAHQDDPERAARAALEIIAAVDEYCREVRLGFDVGSLGVRVGIDTGEVVVGEVGAGSRVEYGAVGGAINTAARLQGAAGPGTALLSATTQRLVADRFEWGEALELTLKGKDSPVVAYPLGSAMRTFVTAPDHGRTLRLVGRERDLDLLRRRVVSVHEGRGGVVVVTGDAGLGKSRMAAELRPLFMDSPRATWLEGRCASYGEDLPYWPYRDMLRTWLSLDVQEPEARVRITLKRRLRELLDGHADDAYPYLGTLLGLRLEPDAAAGLAQVSPESVQYQTFVVFDELLGALCASQPIALFLDDLHWADPTSLQLTEKLAAAVEERALLVVLTLRPEVDTAAWALRERLAREYRHVFSEVALTSLDDADAERIVEQLVDREHVGATVRERLLEYAGGNPFYLEEMARSVQERADSGRADDAALSVPKTVEGAILARLDGLDPTWRRVITCASVLGKSFGFDLLAAVTQVPDAELRDALHHLRRLDLLQDEGIGSARAFRFKHALIQETAYHTLLLPMRESLHRLAATWFETFYADNAERVYGLLAYHFRCANDPAKAALYTRRAADRALAEWSLDEAIEQDRALLPLLEEQGADAEAAEVLFQLATTLHLAMRYSEASETWAEGLKRWRPPDTPQQPARASLIVAGAQVPFNADPSVVYYAVNHSLHDQLYDHLFEARPGPYVAPGLAESWAVDAAGLRYLIRLRPDLRWPDGRQITAADVVFGCNRTIRSDQDISGSYLMVIEGAPAVMRGDADAKLGVTAISDREVEILLSHPCPYFIFVLVSPEVTALRPDLLGSGAFRLTSIADSRVVTDRDPGYARRRGGNVAHGEYRLMSREEMADAARADSVDVLWTYQRPAGRAEDYGMHQEPSPLTASIFLCFPGIDGMAADRELRRALALALDRRGVDAALTSLNVAARGGLVPPGVPGHTPDIVLPYDVAAARSALRDSGHRGPIRLVISREQVAPYQEAMVESWRSNLGLEVTTEIRPMATNRAWDREFHAAIWHWVTHVPDAEYFLSALLHSRSPTHLGGFASPALESLIDAAVTTSDGARRRALFHEADRLAVQTECAVIPIAYGSTSAWVKPWVHGWWQWGVPWQSWDEVTVDDSSPRFRGGE